MEEEGLTEETYVPMEQEKEQYRYYHNKVQHAESGCRSGKYVTGTGYSR